MSIPSQAKAKQFGSFEIYGEYVNDLKNGKIQIESNWFYIVDRNAIADRYWCHANRYAAHGIRLYLLFTRWIQRTKFRIIATLGIWGLGRRQIIYDYNMFPKWTDVYAIAWIQRKLKGGANED